MMPRRWAEEAMDQPDLDPGLLAEDLHNLEILNRFFGGRQAVLRRVSPLLETRPSMEPLAVLDIGSGAGDLCRVLVEACRRRSRPVRLWSLDVHPQVQEYARLQSAGYPEIRFLRADGTRVPLRDDSVDLALCTLALHHFAEEDAVAVLAEMARVTRRWAVVSDLCRSPHAYAGVWLATRFMPNPMTRHDGPVSVRRAFTLAELAELARRAGWTAPELHRDAWFRMSVVLRKEPRW